MRHYKPARHNHSFIPQTFECFWAKFYRKVWKQKDESDTGTILNILTNNGNEKWYQGMHKKVALRICRKEHLTVWNNWAQALKVIWIKWISSTIPAFIIPNSKLNTSLFVSGIFKVFLIYTGIRGVKTY